MLFMTTMSLCFISKHLRCNLQQNGCSCIQCLYTYLYIHNNTQNTSQGVNSHIVNTLDCTELEISIENMHMSAQHKICSDIYKNDLTLVETYAIALNSGLDMHGNCTGKHQRWSENVRCPIYFICSAESIDK